jgi:hypothetical protein
MELGKKELRIFSNKFAASAPSLGPLAFVWIVSLPLPLQPTHDAAHTYLVDPLDPSLLRFSTDIFCIFASSSAFRKQPRGLSESPLWDPSI